MTRLATLDLSHTCIGDAGIARLVELKGLHRVDLTRTNV
jgi:hypothetical protein